MPQPGSRAAPAARAATARRDRLRHGALALGACLLLVAIPRAGPADDAKPLTTILLVARAGLPDPNFNGSVVLVMNNLGTAPAGVILNRPTSIAVARLLPDVEGIVPLDAKVYFGGPVDLRSVSFLFRADTPPEQGIRVLDGVYLSSNGELLRKLLARDKPMDGLRIFVGYAGWSPGQLEAEIGRGDWMLAPAAAEAIFGRKSERPWPGQDVDDPRRS